MLKRPGSPPVPSVPRAGPAARLHRPPAGGTSAATATATATAGPTCLEHLANELQLTILEYSLEQNLDTPGFDGTAALSRLNQPMRCLFAAPRAASETMRAMAATAALPGGPDCAAMLARLDTVPPQYLRQCWESAWRGYVARAPGLSAADFEAELGCLVDRTPPHAVVHPPPWHRAAALLLDRAPARPTPRMVARLLQDGARSPQCTPEAWCDLVKLVERASIGTDADTGPAFLAVAGLNAAQRNDLEVMLACVHTGLRAGDRVLETLIGRIEAGVTPACRWPMLRTLCDGLEHTRDTGSHGPAGLVRDALMRLQGPDRHRALLEMPGVSPTPERQSLLMKIAGELPDAVAIRFLTRHSAALGAGESARLAGAPPPVADARGLFLACLAAIVRGARHDPAAHWLLVREIAEGSTWVSHAQLRRDVAAIALEEGPRLDPVDRLDMLSRLQFRPLFARGWESQWERAVSVLRAQPGCITPAAARSLVGTLRRKHWCLEKRGVLLNLALPALARLPPDALAAILSRLAGQGWDGYEHCAATDFQRLLGLCAQLPFYLRPRPLAALQALAAKAPARCGRDLEDLQAVTGSARRAWDADHPVPVPVPPGPAGGFAHAAIASPARRPAGALAGTVAGFPS